MDWLNILSQVFEIVIIPLLGVGTLYLVSLIKAKKKEIEENLESEKAKEYLTILEDTITSCVIATTQTYVDSLKKQGKFDAEAQKTALKKTFNAVMGILTIDARECLEKVVGDLNTYVLNRIEANVATTKGIF